MITIQRDQSDGRTDSQSDSEVDRRSGWFERFRLYLLRRRADAMLRRTLRPPFIGRAADLSPHLLKDIGLPPDFRD